MTVKVISGFPKVSRNSAFPDFEIEDPLILEEYMAGSPVFCWLTLPGPPQILQMVSAGLGHVGFEHQRWVA